MYHCRYTSPLGELYLLTDGYSLRQMRLLNKEEPTATVLDGHHLPLLQQLLARLRSYFSGQLVAFHDFPVTLTGTPFQQQVWQQLNTIPYGTSCTYGQLAKMINQPRAARAVGNAVGANPLMILLPCHRVLGYQGRLAGYRGGITAKKHLLKLEGIHYHAPFL